MKKQLLTALFTFTPFFIAAKPTDAELLVHLKTIKKDIEHMIQECNFASKEMQKECAFGKDYFFFLNMINEIDQQLNHSLKNRFLGELSNKSIELICNDMKTTDDINDIINTNAELLLESGFVGSIENDEKETALITSIFTKHHKKYCIENPNNDFTQMQFTDLCHSDTLAPFFVNIIGIEWLNELLKKVDAKIQELQKA